MMGPNDGRPSALAERMLILTSHKCCVASDHAGIRKATIPAICQQRTGVCSLTNPEHQVAIFVRSPLFLGRILKTLPRI